MFLFSFKQISIFSTHFDTSPRYKISWKSFQWETSCSMPTDERTGQIWWS